MRPIISVRIDRLQAVLDDIDNPAQNLAIIGTAYTARLGKERSDPFDLILGEPKQT